MFVLNAKLSSI